MDKFESYVEEHPLDVYIDYNDSLSNEQVNRCLKGEMDEVRWEIEDSCTTSEDDYTYYWEQMSSDLECSIDEIKEWMQGNGFYPSYRFNDSTWGRLLRNTNVCITATMWEADWNFNNWAYGAPVSYTDVKESLKILGINPNEFRETFIGGSATSGDGKFKGWFPDMPQRVPKVNVKDLQDNMCVLYDGVLNFCLGDLENVLEVVNGNSEYITFTKGTNIVMYEFGGGAGITDATLIGDVTVKRKDVDFRNDSDNHYGIQECYGFVNSYWEAGGVRNGK